jgi:hypothetical protein
MLVIALLLTAANVTAPQDLASVKSEPSLDRRAQLALDFAGTRLTEARAAYEKGEYKALPGFVEQITTGAELCIQSLEEMGKHPARNVKNYKLAEKRMRELLRRVATFRGDVSFEDRPLVEKAEQRIGEIHEKLLAGALSRKP